MTTYNANSESDISTLSQRIDHLTAKQTRWFLAAIHNAGLMTFDPDTVADIEEMKTNSGQEIDHEDFIVKFFFVLPERHLVDYKEDFLDWLTNGDDKNDASSVGGFNQHEITLLTALLDYAVTLD